MFIFRMSHNVLHLSYHNTITSYNAESCSA